MARYFDSLADPELIKLIKSGAIGVIPTDTVYGLVAATSQPSAVERLYGVKPRKLAPGTVVGATIDDFVQLGFLRGQLDQVANYWPSPLSVVLNAEGVDAKIDQLRTELPVRIPNYPMLIDLLTQTGPLMTTSANTPDMPTSTSIKMAYDYFGDSIDYYVDGGDLSGRPPSTIIGFDSEGKIVVYRQGAVEIKD